MVFEGYSINSRLHGKSQSFISVDKDQMPYQAQIRGNCSLAVALASEIGRGF
jgi:hypothetical protein